MRLQGRAVLVTGAARRVGRAIALALAARGARVAIHYHRSQREAARLAADMKAGFGRDCMAVSADLRDIRAVRRMAAAVAKRFGGISVLINNASAYKRTPFSETTPAQWDEHMDVNLRAAFFLSQAVAPGMHSAGEGKIINIADWSGLRPYPAYIPYCVSKAGLLCLTTALAKQLAPEVQVNAVMPGPVLLPEGTPPRRARIVARANPAGRLGTPEDVAKAVLYLIESGDFVTGAALPVDGGRLIA
ncbi:MAG: SDR family oxidoreductase [Elusimicrobiota bacterium]|jgi:NAD(P)-dependent dehydrogenase (short-subunit alcohol dehydrogenase family)